MLDENFDESILNEEDDIECEVNSTDENYLLEEEYDDTNLQVQTDDDVLELEVSDQFLNDEDESQRTSQSEEEPNLQHDSSINDSPTNDKNHLKSEKTYINKNNGRQLRRKFNPQNNFRNKPMQMNQRFRGNINNQRRPWQKQQGFINPWENGRFPHPPFQNQNSHFNTYSHVQHQNTFLMNSPILPPQLLNNPRFPSNQCLNYQAPYQNQSPRKQFEKTPPPLMQIVIQPPQCPPPHMNRRVTHHNNFNQNIQRNHSNFNNDADYFEAEYCQNFRKTISNFNTKISVQNNQVDMRHRDNLPFKNRYKLVNVPESHHQKSDKEVIKPMDTNKEVEPVKSNENGETSLSQKNETQVSKTTNTNEESEGNVDEETRLYLQKIEEQKRLREEILRKKEENRMKNMEKQIEVIEPVVRRAPSNVQSFKQPPQKVFRTNAHSNNILITGNDNSENATNFNGFSENQFGNQPERIVKFTPTNMTINASAMCSGNGPSSRPFIEDRTVFTRGNDMMNTNIVVVKNLASTTNEPKIMQLCQTVGNVQKLLMEKQERRATIHFDSVDSAQAFYKKFCRHMIDLSIIQVELVPS